VPDTIYLFPKNRQGTLPRIGLVAARPWEPLEKFSSDCAAAKPLWVKALAAATRKDTPILRLSLMHRSGAGHILAGSNLDCRFED
jgi:hypothetical protein